MPAHAHRGPHAWHVQAGASSLQRLRSSRRFGLWASGTGDCAAGNGRAAARRAAAARLPTPIPTTRSRKPGACGAEADARRGRAGGGARAGAARARSALPARAGARSCACSRRAQQRSVCAMRVCAPVVSPPCVNEVWRTLHEPKVGAEKRGCGAGGCTDRGSAAGPACRHCGGRSRAPRHGGVRPEDRGGFAESNEVQKTWQSGSAQAIGSCMPISDSGSTKIGRLPFPRPAF